MDVIQKRFDELAETAEKIRDSKTKTDVRKMSPVQYLDEPTSYYKEPKEDLNWPLFVEWKTSVAALIERVFEHSSSTWNDLAIATEASSGSPNWRTFEEIYAIFRSARDQYNGGYLFNIQRLVHADVFADELEQSEYFLEEGHSTPAAVIAGVVLETHLRKLCDATDDIEPSKSLNRMNDDLAKAGVYNKLRADLVRGWAKVRNHAAHGEPDEFTHEHVKSMIEGIRSFIAER